jgi:general secretion pathway protein G
MLSQRYGPVHLLAARTSDRAMAWNRHGLTLIELLMVLALIGTLSTIALLLYANFTEKAMVARAMADIANISSEISTFQMMNERLPVSLTEINRATFKDPWGQAYGYLDVSASPGLARKDGALVPINTDFDLYSKGKDGNSAPPLTASQSRDDIVRANDGQFIGLASNF